MPPNRRRPPCSENATTELSAYTYDEAGEETAITPKADTSGTTFAYNAADELSSLTPSGGSALALSYGRHRPGRPDGDR